MKPTDPEKIESELIAVRTERDAALLALDRQEREAEERSRLLGEEQDRFVSRLLETHDREARKLSLELDEARTASEHLAGKLERERANAHRLEETLAASRAEADRLRRDREVARGEVRRHQQSALAAQATAEQLRAELELARAMLGDAMHAGGPFEDVTPVRVRHENSRPPRDSGIVNRGRGTPTRPPAPRAEPSRAANGRSDAPPSSR